MSAPDYYATKVASVTGETTARTVADLMVHGAIGCVLVRDADDKPVGIITDRDLATRVVAQALDASTVTADEIATKPVHTATSQETIEQVIERMRTAGVRRMPVVRDGALVGIVTIDDLVVQLSREMTSLADAAKTEIDASRRAGRRQRRRAELEESLASIEASVLSLGKEATAFVTHEFETLRDRLRRDRG